MKSAEALALADDLCAWYPSAFFRLEDRERTVRQFADGMAEWDREVAWRAIRAVAESNYRFPSFAVLRDAYASEGGNVPDPGRNMSPRTGERSSEPSPEEEAEISRVRRGLLDRHEAARYSPPPTDDEDQER